MILLVQDAFSYYYLLLCFRGMVYDGNETYYIQPLPGNTNKVSMKLWNKYQGGMADVSQSAYKLTNRLMVDIFEDVSILQDALKGIISNMKVVNEGGATD